MGRDEKADISLPDPEVSRLHARISWFGTQYVIEDLRSTNGTYVNGVRLRAPQPLNHGDKIAVGQTVFEFEWLTTIQSYASAAKPQLQPVESPYSPVVAQPEAAPAVPSATPVIPSSGAASVTSPAQEETSSGTSRCLLIGCGCLVLLTLLFVGAFVVAWFTSPEWMRELQRLLDQYHIPLQLSWTFINRTLS